MGSSVKAACECGYSSEAMIGGGMMNFMTTCLFPAICSDCHELVEVNLLAERQTCEACESERVQAYDQEQLLGELGSEVVVDWHHAEKGLAVALTDGRYLCPKCGQFKLRFEEGGILWD